MVLDRFTSKKDLTPFSLRASELDKVFKTYQTDLGNAEIYLSQDDYWTIRQYTDAIAELHVTLDPQSEYIQHVRTMRYALYNYSGIAPKRELTDHQQRLKETFDGVNAILQRLLNPSRTIDE